MWALCLLASGLAPRRVPGTDLGPLFASIRPGAAPGAWHRCGPLFASIRPGAAPGAWHRCGPSGESQTARGLSPASCQNPDDPMSVPRSPVSYHVCPLAGRHHIRSSPSLAPSTPTKKNVGSSKSQQIVAIVTCTPRSTESAWITEREQENQSSGRARKSRFGASERSS